MSKSKKSISHNIRVAKEHIPFVPKNLEIGIMSDLQTETREQRVKRLYTSGGGPLLGWLLDECRARGMTIKALAADLGVTYGYINQLRCGIREVNQVSAHFAKRAAYFLGIPPVMVKLLSGQLSMSDFITVQQTEEDFVERALCRMMNDPKAGMFVSLDVLSAELPVQKDFLSLYAEVSGDDIFNLGELPEMARWLQRATVEHTENSRISSIGIKENSQVHCIA